MSHETIDLHDHVEPPTGRECAHCGKPQRGVATIEDKPVCHTGGAYPDCYRLISVYGEALGSRHTGRRVRRLLDEWERLGRGDGEHGRQLRAALDPPGTADPRTGEQVEELSFPADWKPATPRLEDDEG